MNQSLVTILYYDENSAELKSYTGKFTRLGGRRVLIDESFKKSRSIIAVCEGRVKVLNKLGDRTHDAFTFMNTNAFQTSTIEE